MNSVITSQSRLAHRLPLHRLAGTAVSKWCRNAIPRWRKRAQQEERLRVLDVFLTRGLINDGDVVVEGEWDEWDEKAMLDIAEVVAEVVYELDVYKGAWKEWNEADIVIDSAKFDDASFYSDDSASWDSSDSSDDEEAPKVDEEERARFCWYSDDSTTSVSEDEVVKVSDNNKCSESEQSASWYSFSDEIDEMSSGEVFIPSVVEEVNIFEGLFDNSNDSDLVVDSPEAVEGSFYSYHSSSWDSSWDSSDEAAGDCKSYDLDWLYPVVEQIYDMYLEL